MRLCFAPDRMLMVCDSAEQTALRSLRDEDALRFDSDAGMADLFESLIANSELDWVPDGITGDLTSAPMLGVFGKPERAPKRCQFRLEDFYGTGRNPVGVWDGFVWCQPLLCRWAFMDYAVTSPQRELAERGMARWMGGPYLKRGEVYTLVDFDCSLAGLELLQS